tara:strand:+ start:27707 stop:27925 length:219 start_codon:yes stop_codon:yes gene_type:complete
MANTVATIQSSSTPIVTKIIKNQTATTDITGLNINYQTVANGEVLAYNSSSNTFVPVSVASARGGIDGGEVT